MDIPLAGESLVDFLPTVDPLPPVDPLPLALVADRGGDFSSLESFFPLDAGASESPNGRFLFFPTDTTFRWG